MDTLVALNPKLREENWVKAKGPCHLLVNAHVEICAHRLDLEPPLRTLATSSWVLSPGVPWAPSICTPVTLLAVSHQTT